MNAPEQICNLALSRLGCKNTVSSISDPKSPEERLCKIWYDSCRQIALKKLAPNCALGRKIVPKLSTAPVFGYAYAYQCPTDCLKVLGIGDIQDKENNYAVEEGKILTDEDYENGMNLRYVKNLTDVSKFSIEVILAISAEMAEKMALPLAQDEKKLELGDALIRRDENTASALNGQENRPIRINKSKFKQARTYDSPSTFNKR